MEQLNMKRDNWYQLNNNQLKIIAMVTMLIDHIGVGLFSNVLFFRIIGRISFPIFAYMIAEGCTYTRKRASYLGKIALLGVGCQLVYAIAMQDFYQGILITFSLSILTIYAIDGLLRNSNAASAGIVVATLGAVVFLTMIAPEIWKKYGFGVDYGILGVLFPVAVYYAKEKRGKLMATVLMMLSMGVGLGGVQWYAFLAFPFLLVYNGKRGTRNLKYLFYIFYPSHLVLIYLLGLLLG